jgi:hypothetical protein
LKGGEREREAWFGIGVELWVLNGGEVESVIL